MFRKTIRLFLIDGEPNGRISAELSNWTGKGYKIPRIKIKECGDRPELENPGIYLLFGKDEDGNNQVYIGEAEEVLKRLNQQLAKKEFWNEAIAFISKDENLNKAHIKYLENELHYIAEQINRYQVENNVIPTKPSISEPDQAEMEEFISNIKILTNTLGHKVFEQKREVRTSEEQKEKVFYIKSVRGADASGEPTADGFVIFEESQVAHTEVDSLTPSFRKKRRELEEEGIIEVKKDGYFITEDYVASSPSTAAVIVLGRNANGLSEWKLEDGTTLKEYESAD
ncbi:MAG: GIY-YIG nuclease family protein [Bacteroidota bacterium]